MSGLSNFLLIDPDILEAHNIVRHAADLRYVGQPKVEAVKDLILNRNREARVEAIQANVFDCIERLSTVDLILVAGLGSEIATAKLAMEIRAMERIALFGGIYEKAVAGEVFIVNPKSGPCYACFASVLRSVGEEISIREVDYGLPIDELKAQPGLGTHISRVSSVFADWAIRLAIHDNSVLPAFPGNLVILSNQEYTLGNDEKGNPVKLPPSSSRWFWIPKSHDCIICNPPPVSFETVEDMLKENST